MTEYHIQYFIILSHISHFILAVDLEVCPNLSYDSLFLLNWRINAEI